LHNVRLVNVWEARARTGHVARLAGHVARLAGNVARLAGNVARRWIRC